MVCIAYYTELYVPNCNYAQKQRICRENSKHAPPWIPLTDSVRICSTLSALGVIAVYRTLSRKICCKEIKSKTMTFFPPKLSLLCGGGTFPRNNLFPPFQKSLATSGRRRRAKQNILISSIAASAFYSYIKANVNESKFDKIQRRVH